MADKANKKPAIKDGKTEVKPVAKPGPEKKQGSQGKGKSNKQGWKKSQQQAAPNEKPVVVAPTPNAWSSYVLDDRQKAYLKEILPQLTFGQARDCTKHSHPLLALERKFAEEEALKLIGEGHAVLDIGGNPLRHARSGRSLVFSCCPILNAADTYREAERQKQSIEFLADARNNLNPKAMYCNHKVEECKCINYLALLSVHSIYYLSIATVLQLVNQPGRGALGLYAVMHNFTNSSGTMALGEAYWQKSGDTVTMHVAGNISPYEHPSASWVFTEGGYYDRAGMAMTWNIVRTIGSSIIIKFVKSATGFKQPPKLPTLALSQALASDQESNVDLRNVLSKGDKIIPAALEVHKLDVDRVVSTRDWIKITSPSSVTVTIPKGLISAAAFWIAGKTRDSSNYSLLMSQMKREVVKYNVPPEIAVNAVIWASAIGFTMNIDSEVAAHGTVYETSHFKSKLLNQLIKHDYYGVTSWKTLVGIGAFVTTLVISLLTFRLFGGSARRMLGLSNKQVQLLAKSRSASLRSVYFILADRLRSIVGYLGTKLKALIQPFTIHVPGIWVATVAPFVISDVCVREIKAATPIHHSAKVKVLGDDHCEAKFGMLTCGPVPAEFATVMPRSCIHNEYIATVNRALIDRPDTHEDLWGKIKWERIFNMDLVREIGKVRAVKFDEWISRFPKSRRVILRQAKSRLNEGDVDVHRYHHCDAFVKKEHTLKFDNDEVQPFDPRLIQGFRPTYQVETGPITLALSKWLAKCWKLNPCRGQFIVYTSGMNAHELGKAIAEAVDWLGGDPEADEDDCSRWDAHINRDAINAKHYVYRAIARIPKKYDRALKKQHETKGATPHGVKYEIDETVKSGSGDTSNGNTTQNGGAHFDTYVECGIKIGDFIIFVLGDDILILVRRLLEYRGRHPRIENRLRRFGLQVKFQGYDSLHLAEFCSGRFWPSNERYTFGPKIGRSLVKMYRCIHDVPDPRKWVGEVTYANSLDHSHIPILRAVNQAMLSHTQGYLRPKEVDDHKIHAAYKVSVVDETWDMMNKLYNVSKDEILRVENWILATFTSPVLMYNHPMINRIIRTDIFERYGNVNKAMEDELIKIGEDWLLRWDPTSEFINSVLAAPLIEEWVKGWLPGGWKTFAIFENLLYAWRLRSLLTVMPLPQFLLTLALVRAPATFMHWATSKLRTYRHRVYVHGFFNLVVWLQSNYRRNMLFEGIQNAWVSSGYAE